MHRATRLLPLRKSLYGLLQIPEREVGESMARRKRKPRERMDAWVTVRRLSLGWHGKKGGKAVTFAFYGKSGSYLGKLGVSSATLYWHGSKKKKWARIPTGDLELLFGKYY